jgi:hypothetical protein
MSVYCAEQKLMKTMVLLEFEPISMKKQVLTGFSASAPVCFCPFPCFYEHGSPPQLRTGGASRRGGADRDFKLLVSKITTPSLDAPTLLNQEGNYPRTSSSALGRGLMHRWGEAESAGSIAPLTVAAIDDHRNLLKLKTGGHSPPLRPMRALPDSRNCPNLNVVPPLRAAPAGLPAGATLEIRTATDPP